MQWGGWCKWRDMWDESSPLPPFAPCGVVLYAVVPPLSYLCHLAQSGAACASHALLSSRSGKRLCRAHKARYDEKNRQPQRFTVDGLSTGSFGRERRQRQQASRLCSRGRCVGIGGGRGKCPCHGPEHPPAGGGRSDTNFARKVDTATEDLRRRLTTRRASATSRGKGLYNGVDAVDTIKSGRVLSSANRNRKTEPSHTGGAPPPPPAQGGHSAGGGHRTNANAPI